ncbi:hypothetical protein Pcatena_02690 [Parolsenella catena]|uniref:Uncharacterized protein n=1 Tax=Parolsenella catena TaxID=2003188 RepID=A0A3G9K4Z5_9ACTN|nr:hypothetical protein Pcatena_02690 [Parolsenella catena]
MDDEQLLGCHPVLAAELGDGSAARVHEVLRHGEDDLARALLAADAHDGDLGAALALPVAGAQALPELLYGAESRVVAGVLVLLAWVAETRDEANLLWLCCWHALSLSSFMEKAARLSKRAAFGSTLALS